MGTKFNDILEDADINLEEIISKTKEAAEVIGKKSAEKLEQSRKKVEYFDTKSKLNKQYEKYGRLCFDQMMGEEVSEDELSECAAKISELKDKLEILSVEVEAAKEKFNDAVNAAAQKAQKAYEGIKKEFEGNGETETAEVEIDPIDEGEAE